MWWKKNKFKVIVPVLIVAVLVVAFYFGGDHRGSGSWGTDTSPSPAAGTETVPETTAPAASPSASASPSPEKPAPEQTPTSAVSETAEPSAAASSSPTVSPSASPEASETPVPSASAEPSPSAEPTASAEPSSEPSPTPSETPSALPSEEPSPSPTQEPEPTPSEQEEHKTTCTLSISCATILDNMDLCKPDKREIIPSDGWILGPVTVEFEEGESAFDVLQRATREHGIHFEYSFSPFYNSAYVEGIANIYEFDVGELSGWMYSVNDWFPGFGLSGYIVKDGDVIKWQYTCDLGADIGGSYAVG